MVMLATNPHSISISLTCVLPLASLGAKFKSMWIKTKFWEPIKVNATEIEISCIMSKENVFFA